MRAVELRNAYGIENLVVARRSLERLGPKDVLVRIDAVSINYRDILMVLGKYNPKQKLPLVPCSDGVGVVLATGSEVERVALGDRVLTTVVQGFIHVGTKGGRVLKRTLGGPLDGVLQEQLVLHEDGLVRAPSGLSDAEASTLPCAALTAWAALTRSASLQPGDTILVQGTGGVSLFALQFGKMLGLRVIVTSKSDEKLKKLQSFSPWRCINYQKDPDWATSVWTMTEKLGVDHVIEVGGIETLAQSLRAVRFGGTVSLIGVLSGAVGRLNLEPIIMRNVRLQGILVGSRDEFEAMNAAIHTHQIRPIVDRVFPMEQVADALRYMAEGKHFGKVVLSVRSGIREQAGSGHP